MQIPDRFFREEMARQGIDLPQPGHYGVGYLFMPRDAKLRTHAEEIVKEVIAAEGQQFIGFREVAVDNSSLSKAPDIAATEPFHVQVFIGRNPMLETDDDFERRLLCCAKSFPTASIRKTTATITASTSFPCRRARSSTRACSSLPGRQLLSGFEGSAFRKRCGAGSPAFLDQHLPVLAFGSPLPHGRA